MVHGNMSEYQRLGPQRWFGETGSFFVKGEGVGGTQICFIMFLFVCGMHIMPIPNVVLT